MLITEQLIKMGRKYDSFINSLNTHANCFGWTKKLHGLSLSYRQVPAIGSILYCKLAFFVEHTGIYIGDGKVVHLDGDGCIRILSRLNGLNPAYRIYYSVDKQGEAFGNKEIAERAKNLVGTRRKYNLFLNNCHRFTGYCLTGKNNVCTTFSRLKKILNGDYGVAGWQALHVA